MCALLCCCVHHRLEAQCTILDSSPTQDRSFVFLHNDKLDQVSFKTKSTKTTQASDYIIYILSNTTGLLGSEAHQNKPS